MWQNVLREIHGNIIRFQFNTYLISIFVIFFFQVVYDAPVVKDIKNFQPTNFSNYENEDVLKFAREFFLFYGVDYNLYRNFLSVHLGQWHETKTEPTD